MPLAGRPLFLHALDRFLEVDGVQEIVIAAPPDEAGSVRKLVPDRVHVVPGGRSRQESVQLGLDRLSENASLVAVHDAARPLVSSELIREVFREAGRHGAAIAAVPVTDTVKEVDPDGAIVRTGSGASLWLAQTPQAFRVDWLREAFEHGRRSGISATDCSGLVERLGRTVHVVRAAGTNLKVTWPEDLQTAEAILANRK